MKITDLLPSQSDMRKFGKRAEATAAADPSSPTAAGQPTSTAQTEALRKIMAQYDVNQITPNQFTQLVEKLHDAGVLNQQDVQSLSAVRSDLGAAHIEPDESVNLVDFYRQKVEDLQRQSSGGDTGAQSQLTPMRQRLDWIEKFATAHSKPDSLGLTAVA
jgi:hypothetical protein